MSREITVSSGNVFRDLGFAPAEAAHLLLRSDLMLQVERVIRRRKLTQTAAARLFGVSQPRVSDLHRGRIDRFSLDALVQLLARAGVRVDLVVREGGKAKRLGPAVGQAHDRRPPRGVSVPPPGGSSSEH